MLRRKENSVNRDRIVTYLLRIQTLLAQHVAGNSKPELAYSAIFAPTDDELFDVMIIIPLDGRAIYSCRECYSNVTPFHSFLQITHHLLQVFSQAPRQPADTKV